MFVAIYAGVLGVTAFFPEASFVKLLGEYYLFALCFLTYLHCRDREFVRRVVVTCGRPWKSPTAACGRGSSSSKAWPRSRVILNPRYFDPRDSGNAALLTDSAAL